MEILYKIYYKEECMGIILDTSGQSVEITFPFGWLKPFTNLDLKQFLGIALNAQYLRYYTRSQSIVHSKLIQTIISFSINVMN